MIHTLSAQKVHPRRKRLPVTSAQNLARYLVAEYLHDWGLKDPEIIAAESRRIVEQAESLTLAVPPDLLPQQLCETAIRLTVDEVEALIAGMATTTHTSRGRLTAAPTNDSILPHIAHVLLEFPEAIRHRDRPPASLLSVLETSLSPIVPYPNTRQMLPQPRTRLWKVLRKVYWKCLLRNARVRLLIRWKVKVT